MIYTNPIQVDIGRRDGVSFDIGTRGELLFDIRSVSVTISHPPRISDRGTWEVWDGTQYIDTGIPAVNSTYIYEQMTPASVWTIEHNLARFPAVAVVDSAGSAVVGDVQYIDQNTVTVTFQSAFSGIAYLN